MDVAGAGAVPLQWNRQPTAANRKGKTAPVVEFVAHGEPSNCRWKPKGTTMLIPLRNGWITMVTVEGNSVRCCITVADGSTVAVFSMSTTGTRVRFRVTVRVTVRDLGLQY